MSSNERLVSRRSFLGACGACGAAAAGATPWLAGCAAPSAARGRRPNIVLIMVDDMGYSDIGCYGAEIRTPNLDRLAAGGMRFTHGYNNAICAPTRASLMTGLYPHQVGIGTNIAKLNDPFWSTKPWPGYQSFRRETAAMIPELLRPAGYQTFMAGKWHLGDEPERWPVHRGFDRSFALVWGGSEHFKPRWAPFALDGQPYTEFPADFYTTDYFTKYAIEFVDRADRERPYFLYLSYSAPHLPWEAWPEDIAKYKGAYAPGWEEIRRRRFARQKEMGLFAPGVRLPPRDPEGAGAESDPDRAKWAERLEVYAAMIDRVDQNVGRLLEAIERRGERENTLILFLSDNGAWATRFSGLPWAETGNTPFRLFKGWNHEGGICTPLIAHWPGRVPAGTINRRQYAHVKDFMPTFLDLAGAAHPRTFEGHRILPLEGRSFLPALLDPDAAHNTPVFWECGGNGAMRDGRWKLVRFFNEGRMGPEANEPPRTGAWELYDLETDPTEIDDLASREPGRLRAMAAAHEAWARRVGVVPQEEIARALKAFREREQQQAPPGARADPRRAARSDVFAGARPRIAAPVPNRADRQGRGAT